MGIFRKQITFNRHDPLDDGLRDAITAEQRSDDSFTLADPTGEELTEKWDAIVKDVEKDPGWFSFSKD